MAAWTTISNALVAVGAKPFATTIQALRDNPIAIAEGASGAPRVQAGGIASGAVTRVKLESPTLGDSIRVRADTETSTTSTSYVDIAEFAIIRGGDLRMTFDHRVSSSSGSMDTRILINGTVVATRSNGSDTYASRTEDLTAVPNGARITVQHRVSSSVFTAFTRNIRARTGGEMVITTPLLNITDVS
jgi:hypothetical protein